MENITKILPKSLNPKFIPISAFDGDNLITKSDKSPWYQGPTVLDYLLSLEIKNHEAGDIMFCMPISRVHGIKSFGTITVGKVLSGTLKPGQQVFI
jgi:elongation factor 1-alpha